MASCVAAAVATVVLCTSSAQASGGRAHLSDDLRRGLTARNSTDTDVILTGTRERVKAIAARHGLQVRRHLKTGAVVGVPAGRLATLAEDPDVDQVAGDHAVRAMLAVATVAIGAGQAWAGDAAAGVSGTTGHGIGVAVIDSGVAEVPALRGRLVARLDFTPEERIRRGRVGDGYGHGTHVAGIIAAASPGLTGVAPRAHIVSVKVPGANGSGRTSDVIEAVDRAIEHKDQYRLRVITTCRSATRCSIRGRTTLSVRPWNGPTAPAWWWSPRPGTWAGVAAALLLDEAPAASQSELRRRLQQTASRVGGAGLLQRGAGSLNVPAALQFPGAGPVSIAGEVQQAWGYSFSARSVLAQDGAGLALKYRAGETEIRILRQDDVIIWGEHDVIIWGENDVIIWGENDVIIWGEGDQSIWSEGEVIIWGERVY